MNLLLRLLGPVLIGFLLDLLLGDPVWPLHPVRLMGHLIGGMERIIRSLLPETSAGERAGGVLLVIFVCLISFLTPCGILVLLYRLQPVVGFLAESLLCYQLLALRSLKQASDAVYEPLVAEDLPRARRAVGNIVGRDPDRLDEAGVLSATVETIAENTSDGEIAPLLYLMIGGAPLGCLYKAINTMDSMVGYQNEREQDFGWAAAKVDDIANLLPARLTALLMLLAAFFFKMDASGGYRVYRRDRKKTASPNAGQTESVMAGVLHVQLGGDAWYFGQRREKPHLGDPIRPLTVSDIKTAQRLLYGSAFLGLVLLSLVKAALILLL